MSKNSIVLLLRKSKILSFVYLRLCLFINRQAVREYTFSTKIRICYCSIKAIALKNAQKCKFTLARYKCFPRFRTAYRQSTIGNRQFSRGFLLIEALVAIALLAMTLTGTLLYFQYHLSLVAYQRQKTEINNCMTAAMEYFTSLKPTDMLVSATMPWDAPTKFNDNTAAPGLYNLLVEGIPDPDKDVACFRFSESPVLQLRYTPSMTCDVACIDKTTGGINSYSQNSACQEAVTPCQTNERRDVKYRFSLLVSWKSPISNTDKSKQVTTFLLSTE